MVTTTEGVHEWNATGITDTYKTWYRVYGNIATPLVVVHGGPGIHHQYLESLKDRATETRPVFFYDQVGCGQSTRLKESTDTDFWKPDKWLEELEALLKHLKIENNYDLFGHSFGGSLAALHASKQPKGLRKLILANAFANAQTCETAVKKLLDGMPDDVKTAIQKGEDNDKRDTEEYQDALKKFLKKHACRVDPWPKDVQQSEDDLDKDSTVYEAMWGPSEFALNGSLKDWSITADDLSKIKVPTLLINSRYDLTQDDCVQPFFDNISKVKWYKFAESSHMPHLEEKKQDFVTDRRG